MKKGVAISIFVLGFILVSCVSLQDRTMTSQERERSEIIGSVTVDFTSTHFLHIRTGIREKAYVELKKVAQQRYQGNIDIQNIVIAGSFSYWNILWGFLYFASPIILDVQKITATGDVVLYGSGQRSGRLNQQRLDSTLENISQSLITTLPNNSIIDVLSVTSSNRNESEYVVGELEYLLVNSGKFMVVDRRRLDQIRSEQNFQISGDVDDTSAVSIGNMLGASIVITAEMISIGTLQKIEIKALDVKTAQIIIMAREEI